MSRLALVPNHLVTSADAIPLALLALFEKPSDASLLAAEQLLQAALEILPSSPSFVRISFLSF